MSVVWRTVVPGLLFLCLVLFAVPVLAQTFTLPGGPLPSGCTSASNVVTCNTNLSFGNNVTINVNSPTIFDVAGDFTLGNNFNLNATGSTANLLFRVSGNLNTANGSTLNGTLIVGGSINAPGQGSGVHYVGSVTVGGNFNLGNNSTVQGNMTVGSSVNIAQNVTITGNIIAQWVNINGGNSIVNGNINASSGVNNNGTINGDYVNTANAQNLINNNVPGINATICNINNNVGPCVPTSGPDPVHHYRITHGGNGLTCEPYPLTVTACGNASCGTTVSITGSVTVQAGSFSATGNFSNSATVSLSLAITNPGTYSLAVSAATVATSQTPSPAWICPTGCGVNISTAALLWDNIGPQVAGQPFAAAFRAVRAQTDPTAACVADVTGPRQVQLGVQCLDPATCLDSGTLARAGGTPLVEVPGSVAVSLTFDANGRAEVPGGMRYDDAGRIRFTASTTGNSGATLSGNSNDFVVRPASIAVTVAGPGGYGGGVLARAGDDLLVTLTALNALGVATRNFGNESAPARLELSGGVQVTAPAGGAPGQLQNTGNFTAIGNGSFERSNVRYLEVGVARFEARIVGGSYLGVATSPSLGAPYGRFIPWDFALDMGIVQPFCNAQTPGFSYMAQPFEVDSLRFSARHRDGGVTLNYPHVQQASLRLFSAGRDVADDLVDLSVRLDPDTEPLSWNDGLSDEISISMLLERLAVDNPDGPYSDFQLAVRLNDEEPTGPYSPMRNPDFSLADGEDCALDDSCNLVMLGLSQSMVFGRLIMPDVFGPETEPLEVSLRSYYWNGSDFQPWTRDSCSLLDSNNLQLVANPQSLGTSAQGGSSTMLNGRSADGSAYWTAPGASGRIEFLYEVPDWFKFGTDNNGDPGASGEFGRFRGHDSIIEWRRVFP